MSLRVPEVTLNNGVLMPQIGFGVFRVPSAETAAAVLCALESGYRSIDTAAIYGNEAAVGDAIHQSGVPRDELFVTTKLWNDRHERESARAALQESLDRLGLDYVDLYLIHWPVPSQDRYVEAWQSLQWALETGLVRAIGVSNFEPVHLRRILSESDVVPAVNQIELHPWFPQRELSAFGAQAGIVTEAWAPLGQGGTNLDEPALHGIGGRHGKSPAQVVLRWHTQLGHVCIPKSVTPARIAANLDVFDFALTAEEMDAISRLSRGQRLGPDPLSM